jgi:hypothetical protein
MAAVSKGFARVCELIFPEIARRRVETRRDAPKAPPTSLERAEIPEGGACSLLPLEAA